MIQSKSSQVDSLISDLFRAHADEIAALSMTAEDLGTDEVEALMREADHRGLMSIDPLPVVLICADRLRLAQIIDNVVQNSYKYANTPIRVSGRLEEGSLRLSISDEGPGIEADAAGTPPVRPAKDSGCSPAPSSWDGWAGGSRRDRRAGAA